MPKADRNCCQKIQKHRLVRTISISPTHFSGINNPQYIKATSNLFIINYGILAAFQSIHLTATFHCLKVKVICRVSSICRRVYVALKKNKEKRTKEIAIVLSLGYFKCFWIVVSLSWRYFPSFMFLSSYYIDRCLQTGCSISCSFFEMLSSLIGSCSKSQIRGGLFMTVFRWLFFIKQNRRL